MRELHAKENWMDWLASICKLGYLFLGLSTFTSVLYDSVIQAILIRLVLVLGTICILVRVVFWEKYIKMPGWTLLAVFCVSFAVSTIANAQYGGVTENGKWLIWTGIQFFLLYVCDTKRDTAYYKKEFHLFANVMILYSFAASVISLQYLIKRHLNVWETADREILVTGFQNGRLWGVYTDPNYGAVFAVITIVLALFYVVKMKSWLKLPYIFSAIVNLVFLIFTDSRTGEIAFACSVGFFLFAVVSKKISRKKIVIKGAVLLLCIGCMAILAFGGMHLAKKQYNAKLQPIFAKMYPKEMSNAVVPPKSTVGRQAEISKDVTNGRFAIWESGMQVWKTSPLVGTGYTTFVNYTKKHLPQTYVVNNSQSPYTSLHNAFLNVLVYQGLIGAVILAAFIIYIVKLLWRLIWNDEDEQYLMNMTMTAAVGAVFVAMLFLLEGLYTNSPAAFVLWTFLGLLMQYRVRAKKNETDQMNEKSQSSEKKIEQYHTAKE
ncbi:MAG: O-antigen ligase family protein [Hespellia sp.]|nr:O-antigen ligase family protein [Hespellia sp.]